MTFKKKKRGKNYSKKKKWVFVYILNNSTIISLLEKLNYLNYIGIY